MDIDEFETILFEKVEKGAVSAWEHKHDTTTVWGVYTPTKSYHCSALIVQNVKNHSSPSVSKSKKTFISALKLLLRSTCLDGRQ
jgi:hypothetical protein